MRERVEERERKSETHQASERRGGERDGGGRGRGTERGRDRDRDRDGDGDRARQRERVRERQRDKTETDRDRGGKRREKKTRERRGEKRSKEPLAEDGTWTIVDGRDRRRGKLVSMAQEHHTNALGHQGEDAVDATDDALYCAWASFWERRGGEGGCQRQKPVPVRRLTHTHTHALTHSLTHATSNTDAIPPCHSTPPVWHTLSSLRTKLRLHDLVLQQSFQVVQQQHDVRAHGDLGGRERRHHNGNSRSDSEHSDTNRSSSSSRSGGSGSGSSSSSAASPPTDRPKRYNRLLQTHAACIVHQSASARKHTDARRTLGMLSCILPTFMSSTISDAQNSTASCSHNQTKTKRHHRNHAAAARAQPRPAPQRRSNVKA